MVVAVWMPLLIPLLAVPLVRLLAERLAPRPASWLLATTGAVLSACTMLALVLLTGAGLLRLDFVAAAEHLSPPLLRRMSPTPPPLACAAGLALAVTIGAAGRTLCRRVTALLRAANTAPARRGDLAVLPDDLPDAYAVPGRPGTIVVTTGMLRALDAREREVLLAHERAHLSGRHHLFTLVMDVAAVLHPALLALRAPLRYHLERWADESAAGAVGDRRLVARAIARAALARRRAHAPAAPVGALSVAAGPVPRRVAALLAAPPARRSRLLPGIAAALAACVTLSGAGTLDAATDLGGSVEAAETHQHETEGRHRPETVLANPGSLRTAGKAA
ncbi:M56 family metallopeptidase [Actinoallomurus rhizosphaericola]|uniref:M56 family metallopeptidase n=1 Tax=Actinoallomurus rhizosphaericola TaxID=2952536 RepID=UPI002092CFF1|nr:M56 family metallopeptidase [Actinoallomurus rhizosphaericola]MCO5998031.1 M56 family metallopeptidase [Actinoallomurus rhizosphaericola]